ncbi:MAG: TolC family protein [Methylophilaceae bacterium]|uniref:TolC family protein n=1 Tax=Methylobacillus sp. MM3 TaxID=1848039 RepID=UPI0007E0B219|nr:TolC family protein [Methylobacillus sp. MM3]OAJ70919.1 transporter [Methylobacillus sp. MM3]
MKTNKQLRRLALAVALLAMSSAQAEETSAPLGADVQELLQWADTHNPELAAMRYEVEAAGERIAPAGALPDPVLRVELQDFAGPGAPDGFNPLPGKGSGTKYTLMQSIPLWGKRDLRKEVATAQVDQVRGRRQAAVVDIHARIKSAYAQYYQAVGLKKLAEDILRLLNELEAVTQARYAGGLTPQQDVIRAQVEKTMLRSEIISLGTEQHHAMARLNAALGRPQLAPIAEPQTLRRVSPEKIDAAVLQEKVLHGNPLLAAQSAQVSAADANRRLVEKNRYPDVTLGIAPTQRGGSIDSWEAMVEFNIPLRFDTRRSQESEASAMLAAARERRQAVANQLAAELQESLAALDAAVKQEQLIANTLLPQAELTFRSALAGYESGKVDFATLLDAQRAIKRARQDSLKARVEQEVRISEIESRVGEEL